MPRGKASRLPRNSVNTRAVVKKQAVDVAVELKPSLGHVENTCSVTPLKLCGADCKAKPDELATLPFVVCGLCEGWFHFRCLGLPEGQGYSVRGLYHCVQCQKVFRDMRQAALVQRAKEQRLEALERLFTDFNTDYKSLKGQLDLLAQGDHHGLGQTSADGEAATNGVSQKPTWPQTVGMMDPRDQTLLQQSCDDLRKANAEIKLLIQEEKDNSGNAATPLTPRRTNRMTPTSASRRPVSKSGSVTPRTVTQMAESAGPSSTGTTSSSSSPTTRACVNRSTVRTDSTNSASAPKSVSNRSAPTVISAIRSFPKSVSSGPAPKPGPASVLKRLRSKETFDAAYGSTVNAADEDSETSETVDYSDMDNDLSNSGNDEVPISHLQTSLRRKLQRTDHLRQKCRDQIRFSKRNVPSRNYNEKLLFNVAETAKGNDEERLSSDDDNDTLRERFPKRSVPPRNYDESKVADEGDLHSDRRKAGGRKRSTSSEEEDGPQQRFTKRNRIYNVDDELETESDFQTGTSAQKCNRSLCEGGDDTFNQESLNEATGVLESWRVRDYDNVSDQELLVPKVELVEVDEVDDEQQKLRNVEAANAGATSGDGQCGRPVVEVDENQGLNTVDCSNLTYCRVCQKAFIGACPAHGLWKFVKDNDESTRSGFQADNTIPVGLCLNELGGIWTQTAFTKDVIFGPYKGVEHQRHLYKECKAKYCWHIFSHTDYGRHVDGINLEKTNWMRYVRRVNANDANPPIRETANLVAFQVGSQIYFRVIAYIGAGEQLLVDLDDDYRRSLESNYTPNYSNGDVPVSEVRVAAVTSRVSKDQLVATSPVAFAATEKLKCPYCVFSVGGPKAQNLLLNHLSNHTTERPFVCFCGLSFKMVFHLEQHSLVVHKLSPNYHCRVCNMKFGNVSDLQQHLTANHMSRYVCTGCDKRFFYEASLFYHQAVMPSHLPPSARDSLVVPSDTRQTDDCSGSLVNGDLSSGAMLNLAVSSAPLQSKTLDSPIPEVVILERSNERIPCVTLDEDNMKGNNEPSLYTISTTNDMYVKKINVNSVPNGHTRKIGRKFAKAGRRKCFKRQTMTSHELGTRRPMSYFSRDKVKSPDSLPPCEQCQFQAINMDQCKDHLFDHYLESAAESVVPVKRGVLKCKECDYGTTESRIKNFKTHLLYHAQYKLECVKFDADVIQVASNVTHSCRQCHRTFATFARLARHQVRRHIGRRAQTFKLRHPFKCGQCKRRRFPTKAYLISHSLAKHPKKAGYPCQLCHKMFLYEVARTSHVRRKHGAQILFGFRKNVGPDKTKDSTSENGSLLEPVAINEVPGTATSEIKENDVTLEVIPPASVLPDSRQPDNQESEPKNLSSASVADDPSVELDENWPIEKCLASIIDQAVSALTQERLDAQRNEADDQIVNPDTVDESKDEPANCSDAPCPTVKRTRIFAKSKDSEKCHKCAKCGRSYASVESRDRHTTRIHAPKPGPAVCGACNAMFCIPSALRKHEVDQLIGPTYCHICGMAMSYRCHLTTHDAASQSCQVSPNDGPHRQNPASSRIQPHRNVSIKPYIDDMITHLISSESRPHVTAQVDSKVSPGEGVNDFTGIVDLLSTSAGSIDGQLDQTSRHGPDTWPPEWNIPLESYGENHVFEDDDFVYCDDCDKKQLAGCSIHGPLNWIPDTEVAEEDSQKASKSLPKGFFVEESGIKDSGLGVWANARVAKGTVFGPYKGVITYESHETCQSDYCWHIVQKGKPSYCIDGKEVSTSNWMRYINCANNDEQQNLTAFQYKGQIFYRTLKNVVPGNELLVWYGRDFAKILGLDPDEQASEDGSDADGKSKKSKTSKSSDIENRWEEFVEMMTSKCNLCNFSTADLAAMKNHLVDHSIRVMPTVPSALGSDRPRLRCPFGDCGYLDQGNGWFKEHLLSHTLNRPFRCRECGMCLRTKQTFQVHTSKHRNSALFCRAMNRFKCTFCSQVFSSKAMLRSHTSEIHLGHILLN